MKESEEEVREPLDLHSLLGEFNRDIVDLYQHKAERPYRQDKTTWQLFNIDRRVAFAIGYARGNGATVEEANAFSKMVQRL